MDFIRGQNTPYFSLNFDFGPVIYGWRNGAKFTKFILIHIQCSYCYSRIYLFTLNNRVYIQKIYLFTFTSVFLIHDYICSHLRDVFIHIQHVIFIHIHDRNIHSAFSAHHLWASLGPSSRCTISECNMADGEWPKTYDPKHKCYIG